MINITSLVTSVALILGISITALFTPVQIGNYRGVLRVRVENVPSFQLNGVIFGNSDKHEYGHYLQQKDIGNLEYYCKVAIPSAISAPLSVIPVLLKLQSVDEAIENYYALPWEADADRRSKEAGE